MDGYLLIDRAFFSDRRWLAEKPFRKGDAWLDLLGLANTSDAVMEKRGLQIELKRGDVGWSIKGLADRWGWSQGKVRACLEHWQRAGQIDFHTSNETTITHIANFANYQDGLSRSIAPNRDQIENKLGANCDQIETEKGEGRREKGTEILQGEKGEGSGANHPDLDTVLAYFASNGSDHWPDEVRNVFNSFAATADRDGVWFIGRRPVGDWRAAMETRLGERRLNGKKISAPRPDTDPENRFAVPRPPGHARLALEEMNA